MFRYDQETWHYRAMNKDLWKRSLDDAHILSQVIISDKDTSLDRL